MTDAQGNKYTSEKFYITEDGNKFSFNIKKAYFIGLFLQVGLN